MPKPPSRSPFILSLCVIALFGIATVGGVAARAEQEVIAVVACDGYNDLRKQLMWFGEQVGNPGIAIMAESMIAMGTQGRGLAGLDASRPLGVVLTADGDAITGNGFVPVKDLDKLLDSLKGIVGPAEADGDHRRIAAPGAGGIRVSAKNGWAVLAPELLPESKSVDPAELIVPMAEEFTIAIKIFPSRMPKALRGMLADRLKAAAAESAARGQPIDERGIDAMIASLDQTESMTIGVRLDAEKNRILIENQTVAVAGSDSAKAMANLGDAPLTVPLPTGGAKPVVRAFVAQQIPKETATQLNAWIDASQEGDSDDPLTRVLLGALRAVAKAAVASGRLDGSMAVVADREGAKPAVEITAGMHVADGASLETSLKKLLGPDADLPKMLAVTLDAGRVANANLHTMKVDLSGSDVADSLGDSLEATVAIAPDCCYILAGGDVKGRLAGLLGSAAPAAGASRPAAAVQIAVDKALKLAANPGDANDPVEEAVTAAAAAAAAAETATLQVQLRRIERGLAWQVSADAGVVKAAAAAAAAAQGQLPMPGGAIGP